MAIARQTDATKIRPSNNATVERSTIGATVAAGELLSLQSDGKYDPANTTSTKAVGVRLALAAGVDGDTIDTVVHGRVMNAITGGTSAAVLHASDTAGEPAESAGSQAGIAGYVLSATDVFIQPVQA